MNENRIQLREKGVLTLPVSLRRKYNLKPGDVFEITELGDDGTLVLSPRPSRVAALGDKVAEILEEEGVSVADVLRVLEEEREQYYHDHYANAKDEAGSE